LQSAYRLDRQGRPGGPPFSGRETGNLRRALCFRRFRAPLNSPVTDRPGGPGLRAGQDLRFERFGLLLWLAPLVVVAVLVAHDPASRTVTPTFHLAVQRWRAGHALYSDPRGFHYLPQFVLLFAPFQALPSPFGDILWRCLSVLVVIGGALAWLRRAAPRDAGRLFFFVSLLALGPCLGAVRNGQTNLVFGGLLLWLAVWLAGERWRRGALCLVLLCTVKPFGIVFVLLAPFVYPRLLRPLLAGLALFLLVPFLFGRAGYVADQYRGSVEHIAAWTVTTENRFADLGGLLRAAGVALPVAALTAIRTLAAFATLGLWAAAGKRVREPWRALGLALLGGVYVMLFSPMTEKNTYAVIAPALAIAAVVLICSKSAAVAGGILAFALVSIGAFPEIFRPLDPDLGLWWDPLVLAAAAGALGWTLVRTARGSPARPAGRPAS
jgi:hypothetical protein